MKISFGEVVIVPLIYLSTIGYLKEEMKGQEPYKLNLAMKIYNSCQIILNCYMIYGFMPLISLNNPFGLNQIYNENIKYYVYIHYLSKYFDFLDTFFIVLRSKKNQLSFLHLYHHSTIGMIWGLLLVVGHGNGTAAFGCLINSYIHLIMYSHYLWTSFGFVNPYKKLITQAQLFQFILCFIHSLFVIAFENIVPRAYAYIQVFYQIQMILLFTNFYFKSYKIKKIN